MASNTPYILLSPSFIPFQVTILWFYSLVLGYSFISLNQIYIFWDLNDFQVLPTCSEITQKDKMTLVAF